MAIYSIDKTNAASVYAGIKAALTTAGILTTTHYETNSLIVTTTRCSRVIRMKYEYDRLRFFIGTGYTSGDAIDGSVTINNYDQGTTSEINVIVTADVLYIGWRNTENRVIHFLCTKLDSTTEEGVVLGWISNHTHNSAILYDTTNSAQFNVTQMGRVVTSSDGYYYSHGLVATTNGNVLLASAIDGVKSLLAPQITISNYVTYGDDVALPGGYTNGAINLPLGLLIVNGASWAPA